MRVLIILAALPWVIYRRMREGVLFSLRKKMGNRKKRGQCCEPLPNDFGIGRSLNEIPELASKTEQICFTKHLDWSLNQTSAPQRATPRIPRQSNMPRTIAVQN